MSEALVRKCNRCGLRFLKAEGCNQMTCRCGNRQCYVCGQNVLDYSHFDGGGRCPMYCDEKVLSDTQVGKAREETIQKLRKTRPDLKEDELPKFQKSAEGGVHALYPQIIGMFGQPAQPYMPYIPAPIPPTPGAIQAAPPPPLVQQPMYFPPPQQPPAPTGWPTLAPWNPRPTPAAPVNPPAPPLPPHQLPQQQPQNANRYYMPPVQYQQYPPVQPAPQPTYYPPYYPQAPYPAQQYQAPWPPQVHYPPQQPIQPPQYPMQGPTYGQFYPPQSAYYQPQKAPNYNTPQPGWPMPPWPTPGTASAAPVRHPRQK